MNLTTSLPAHKLHLLQARVGRSSFKCQKASIFSSSRSVTATANVTLAPSQKPVTSAGFNRLHLSNLQKLLGKQQDVERFDAKSVQNTKNEYENESLERKGNGFLDGLNLARIWPEVKAGDEMSPRHLHHLKRLLSMTAEYSPRNQIAQRWREYHGSKDWAGLLDPLDENLRREVVRYGEFVQAAYHAFHSDPATELNEIPAPKHVSLPDRSYRVTKSLYATASIGLPTWVDDVAPDLGWMTQRSSWIGYVAVCEDRREIQRMGRRDIVIALRGTATCLEWVENVRAQQVEVSNIDDNNGPENEKPKVECGFLSLSQTPGTHIPSLAQSVVDEIHRLMELYKGETLSITVTGHSLGAALALLVADELSTCAPNVPPVAVFSFGGPRVGNEGFVNRINNQNVKVLRIVNNQDVITRVPGIFMSEEVEKKFNELSKNMSWSYFHVGTELRVDTRQSPYLKPDADYGCCHDLEAYLHLVDGFLASNCPFRANAKRSLVRLLNDQRSNVKKLYTSKAKALSLNLERERMPMSSCLPSPS